MTPVEVDAVAHGLERVERDANRKNDLVEIGGKVEWAHPCCLTEKVGIVGEEGRVFEKHENREIGDHRKHQAGFASR